MSMRRKLFAYFSLVTLVLVAGTASASQVAEAPRTSKSAPLPPPPEDRIMDEAHVFSFDPDIRDALSARLIEAYDEKGLDVYVAAYSFLIDESIERRAERLQKAWISNPRGLVVVYVRGGGQMTFAASENVEEFLPRIDLEELFSVAAMSARQFQEPSRRIKAAVEQILFLLEERLHAVTEHQTLFRKDILLLAGLVMAAIFVLTLVGFAIAKVESRPARFYYFPPVSVYCRFGASYGGGSMAEVSFGQIQSGATTRPPGERRA